MDLPPTFTPVRGYPPSNRPIVIYDSGVGGLTVARHLLTARASDHLVYVADNAWFPYGTKGDLPLRSRIFALLDLFVQELDARAIVVACNTASTAIAANLDDMDVDPPIFTVIPPVDDAVRRVPTGRIALLATPGTARRAVVHRLIEQHAATDRITVLPAPELVYLAERKLAGEPVTAEDVGAAVRPLLGPGEGAAFDGVILGCTHFPLLREELAEVFPRAEVWSDPAAATALRVLAHTAAPAGADPAAGVRELVLTGPDLTGSRSLRRVFARNGFGAAVPRQGIEIRQPGLELRDLRVAV